MTLDTKTERNCVRYALENTSNHLEDEIYRLTKQLERGTTDAPLATDHKLKSAKVRLAMVQRMINKLGPFEVEPVEVPDAMDIPHTL